MVDVCISGDGLGVGRIFAGMSGDRDETLWDMGEGRNEICVDGCSLCLHAVAVTRVVGLQSINQLSCNNGRFASFDHSMYIVFSYRQTQSALNWLTLQSELTFRTQISVSIFVDVY